MLLGFILNGYFMFSIYYINLCSIVKSSYLLVEVQFIFLKMTYIV